MNELLINAIGTCAGLCSIASFVPQIIKIWREKAAPGLSLKMFSVTVSAFTLWTLYGILQSSWPIAVSNGICLALAAIIVGLRLYFGEDEEQGAERRN